MGGPSGKGGSALLLKWLLPAALLIASLLWTVGVRNAGCPPPAPEVLQRLRVASASLRQTAERARTSPKAVLAAVQALAANVTAGARQPSPAQTLPLLLLQALNAGREAVRELDAAQQAADATLQEADASRSRAAGVEEELRAAGAAAAGERDAIRHERNSVAALLKAAQAEAEALRGKVAAAEAEGGRCVADRNAAAAAMKAAQAELETQRGWYNRLQADIKSTLASDRQALARRLAAPAVRERWAAELRTLAPRGIVVSAAGAKPLTNAFVALHVLRHAVNCSLPITISYWGEFESVSDGARALFERDIGGVSFLDLSRLPYPAHHRALDPRNSAGEVSGFKIKAYAIYAAPYQEFIALDSDSTAVVNPEELFASAAFQRHGSMFFPDIYSDGLALYRTLGLADPWPGIWWQRPLETRPQQMESGQLLISKARHREALEYVLFLNAHNDYVYTWGAYGDKDTFRAAFDLAGASEDFYQRPGKPVYGLHDTVTETPRYRYSILLQLAPDGRAAFAHRAWIMKYDVADKKGRPTTHVALATDGEQQDRLIKQWGLQPSELQIIPPAECSFDEADVLGSGERCAASAGYNTTLAPTPAFPLSGGHLSRGLQASEEAYHLLLKALDEGGPIF